MSEFHSDSDTDDRQSCRKRFEADEKQSNVIGSYANIPSQEICVDDIMMKALPRPENEVCFQPKNKRQGKQCNSRTNRCNKAINLSHLIKVVCDTKESCLDWMKDIGVISKQMFCPTCNKNMSFDVNDNEQDGYAWICKEEECESNPPKVSPRHGRWFADKEISLVEFLLLTYLWTHNFSALHITRELHMTLEEYEEWDSVFSNICQELYKTELEKEAEESGKASNSSAVTMWRQNIKSRDPLIEFLKNAESM